MKMKWHVSVCMSVLPFFGAFPVYLWNSTCFMILDFFVLFSASTKASQILHLQGFFCCISGISQLITTCSPCREKGEIMFQEGWTSDQAAGIRRQEDVILAEQKILTGKSSEVIPRRSSQPGKSMSPVVQTISGT